METQFMNNPNAEVGGHNITEENENFESDKMTLALFQVGFSTIMMLMILIVKCMKRRKMYVPEYLADTFTTPIIVNFLEEKRERSTIIAVFGITAVYLTEVTNPNLFDNVYITIIAAFPICFICMPLFTCFAIGTCPSLIVGLIYGLVYIILRLRMNFLKMLNNYEIIKNPSVNFNKYTMADDIITIVMTFVFGILMLYGYCLKIYQKMTHQISECHIHKFQRIYLANLLTPKTKRDRNNYKTNELYFSETLEIIPSTRKVITSWRKLVPYSNTKGFRFSLAISVSVTVGSIFVTRILAKVLDFVIYANILTIEMNNNGILENLTYGAERTFLTFFNISTTQPFYYLVNVQFKILYGSMYTSIIVTYILLMFTILHMFKSYKDNVLGIQRHQQLEELLNLHKKSSNVSIVVNAFQYCGYQAAYIFCGVTIQWGLLAFGFIIICEIINLWLNNIWSFTDSVLPLLIAIMLTKLTQLILVKYYFLQEEGKTLGLKNRKDFYNTMYFFFFFNTLRGFATYLIRLVKSIIFSLVFLPRLDRSLFPRSFEHMDTGFRFYICLLKMEILQSNIILVCAANLFLESSPHILGHTELSDVTTPDRKVYKDKQQLIARNRWYLGYTLIRNPQLIQDRRHGAIADNAVTNNEGVFKECLRDIIFPFLNLESCCSKKYNN